MRGGEDLGGKLLVMAIALALAGLAIWLGRLYQRRRHAAAKWHCVWYCFDDDGVFLAGGTELIPSARVPKFLYEP